MNTINSLTVEQCQEIFNLTRTHNTHEIPIGQDGVYGFIKAMLKNAKGIIKLIEEKLILLDTISSIYQTCKQNIQSESNTEKIFDLKKQACIEICDMFFRNSIDTELIALLYKKFYQTPLSGDKKIPQQDITEFEFYYYNDYIPRLQDKFKNILNKYNDLGINNIVF